MERPRYTEPYTDHPIECRSRRFPLRFIDIGLAAAWMLAAVSAPRAGERDRAVCRGIDTSVDSRDASSSSQSEFVWFKDLGFTVLRMDSSVTREDFGYVVDFIELISPSMIEVVGTPVTLDTLTVRFWPLNGGLYSVYLNRIAVDLIRRNPTTGIDQRWDMVFIHELTHAFQDDVLQYSQYPDWLAEGMAEAAEFFVGELVTKRTGRNVRQTDADVRLAAHDLINNGGEQALGGCAAPIQRFDYNLAYDCAFGAVTVPIMAQIAAGFDDPHPLRRLTESLREEIEAPPPHDMYEAVSRAWPAPVDGSNSGQWLRNRSVACPSVRDGELAALIPSYPHNNVNPKDLRILHFIRRYEISYERLPSSATMSYVDAGGRVQTTYGNVAFPNPPDLPPAAYRVDLEEIGQEGQRLTARSWIMMVDPPYLGDGLWQGVAAIFVDKNGHPVDVPREQLSVNGRITARVPGGVIVQTYDGSPGALTFTRNGRVLGTVTAMGSLPRSVVLSVDGAARRPVVSWRPHRPNRNGELTVSIVPELSSLDPRDTSVVDVLLYDDDGTLRSRTPMNSAADGVLEAVVPVPGDLEFGVLSFEKGDSRHGSCWGEKSLWYLAYEFTALPQGYGGGFPLGVAYDGTGVVVAFDAPIDASRLRLRTASDAAGPWTPVASDAKTVSPQTYRWDVSDVLGDGAYFQAVLETSTGGGDEVLFVQYISAAPTALRLTERLPFPNPANGVVQWPFDVASSVDVDFDVFDVAGRRVFSGGKWTLHPGVEVFRWDSEALGTRSPAGVYFLRVVGAGETFTRKIVIVR
jgi:hypothetical protein